MIVIKPICNRHPYKQTYQNKQTKMIATETHRPLYLVHPYRNNSYGLFHKSNHIIAWSRPSNDFPTGKGATEDELLTALKGWTPDDKDYMDMKKININSRNYEYWLKQAFTKDEYCSKDTMKIVLLMSEEGHSEGTEWYKIAIWDKLDERYILRSFTNVSEYDERKKHKILPESKHPGIYVDKSTIRADGKFWDALYNEII